MPGKKEQGEAIERVDAKLRAAGYTTPARSAEIADTEPGASGEIIGWLRRLMHEGRWLRFSRFANLAFHLHPDELAPLLIEGILAGEPAGTIEDMVEMLGELNSAEAIPALANLVEIRRGQDSPYFPLCIKCIQAIGAIDAPSRDEVLRSIATGAYPDPLKWHAAEEVGMIEELGFDEDEMLNFRSTPG